MASVVDRRVCRRKQGRSKARRPFAVRSVVSQVEPHVCKRIPTAFEYSKFEAFGCDG